MEYLSSLWKHKKQGEIIDSLEKIVSLEHINGIALPDLERRAKPIQDNTTDAEWRYRSFDGFLGANETFKQVLQQDWESVHSLGTTSQVLAQKLREILQMVEQKRKKENLGLMRPLQITYLAEGLSTAPQTLLVTHKLYNGYQYSLFFNEKVKDSELNTSWKEEYTITNIELNLGIKLAGNTQSGLIEYIDRFGFYEGGGIANTYRIFPSELVAILTGKCSNEVLTLAEQRGQNKLDHLREELEHCNKLVVDEEDKERLEWTKEQIQKLKKEIGQVEQETQNIIGQLKTFCH